MDSDFPKTIFVTTSGSTSTTNVAGMGVRLCRRFPISPVWFAAATTKSNVLGVIEGTELPPVKASLAAFAEGAGAMNSKVSILTAYLGGCEDVSAAKQQTLAQISRGTGVIFQNAHAAGLGVFRAARKTKKALVIGSNLN